MNTLINSLNYKDKPFCEFILPSLELKNKLIVEKMLELAQLDKTTSTHTSFFVSNTDSLTSHNAAVSDKSHLPNQPSDIENKQIEEVKQVQNSPR